MDHARSARLLLVLLLLVHQQREGLLLQGRRRLLPAGIQLVLLVLVLLLLLLLLQQQWEQQRLRHGSGRLLPATGRLLTLLRWRQALRRRQLCRRPEQGRPRRLVVLCGPAHHLLLLRLLRLLRWKQHAQHGPSLQCRCLRSAALCRGGCLTAAGGLKVLGQLGCLQAGGARQGRAGIEAGSKIRRTQFGSLARECACACACQQVAAMLTASGSARLPSTQTCMACASHLCAALLQLFVQPADEHRRLLHQPDTGGGIHTHRRVTRGPCRRR